MYLIDHLRIFITCTKLTSMLWFCTGLMVLPQWGFAHNGALAYAYPVSNITVDGNLSDWPSNIMVYNIAQLEDGVPAENANDLTATFRVGYDPVKRTIFVAISVTDQSMVLDTAGNVNWNTHDGAELYLDLNHKHSVSEITQYAEYGRARRIFGYKSDWDGVQLESQSTSSTRTYEWAISLDPDFELGRSMAFDVVVMDKDEDGSFSWLAWGDYGQKVMNPQNCGDLLLVAADTGLAEVSGKLDMSKLLSDPVPFALRFTSIEDESSWLQTKTDSAGNYSLSLPVGEYKVDLPPELMRIDEEFYQVADNQAFTLTVNPDQANELPVISPQQIAAPELRPATGILHEFGAKQQRMMDDYMATYMKFYGIPGVSLALIKDRQMVYYRTYGYKNATTREPVEEETLFEAASVTKPVFGFVVLSLAEKGVIDLDKPLYEYLPFEALEVTPEYKKMTARHVLIHRSGLPNWGVPLINTPGTEYGYSGEGFEYLKRVVVEITGKPVEQLLDEELIEPLGLYHMEFKDSPELREVAAIGHLGSHPTYWPIPQEPGMAFSLHTESKAFSKFAIALLNQQGLKPETYLEMVKIHTESPSEYWNNQNYREGAGLGIHVRESPFGNVIGHGGNNGDFKCLFEVYQDLDMGYVVFTNSSMGDQLADDLAEFLVEGSNVGTAEH